MRVHLESRPLANPLISLFVHRLVTLAQESVKVICIPMVERPFLEEWVHPQGRVIAIGEAAHPISVSLPYAYLPSSLTKILCTRRRARSTQRAWRRAIQLFSAGCSRTCTRASRSPSS